VLLVWSAQPGHLRRVRAPTPAVLALDPGPQVLPVAGMSRVWSPNLAGGGLPRL